MTKLTIGKLVTVVILAAGLAHAQTGNKAAAEALFDAGKHLLDAGKFAEACPKLAESQRLDPAPGTLLNLADCYEKAGLTASAWATWLEAAAAAKNSGQTKREELARQRATALKSRLVSITIHVPEPSRVTGLEITRDGSGVGLPMWSTAVPVDPGTHTVIAKAPGRRGWQTTVTVVDGVQPVQVTVPVLEKEAAPTSVPPPIAQAQAPQSPATEPAPKPQSSPLPPPPAASTEAPVQPAPPSRSALGEPPPATGSTQRTLAYVATGIGVVGVAIGSVYGLKAISKNSESRDQCSTATLCNQKGLDLRNEAFDAATFSTVGFGIGTVGLVASVILWVTAPTSPERPPTAAQTGGLASVRLSPSAPGTMSGLSLGGSF